MSFGWSGGDVFLLTQLAWSTVQNSRKACGEYDEVTREALRLHAVLQRLEQEVAKPDSPINRGGGTSKDQLERIATDCEVVLKQVDKIVMAYAALSEEKRSVRKIWQKSSGWKGMAEFFETKIGVEKKTAHTVLCGVDREGTILTTYTDDDTGFWKGLRRDLVKEGLPSAAINKHKHLIKKYIKELGDRGILDDHLSQELNQQQCDNLAESEIMEEVEQLPNGSTASFNVTQTLGQNLETRLSEDLNEQFSHDSLNDTLRIDTESKSLSTDSCVTVLQTLGEQSYEATDEVGITPEAKFNSQPLFSNSILRESTHTGNKPQNVPPTSSVPYMHREERPRKSMNEARKTHSHTANDNDDECGAGKDGAVHDQSSHDVLFPSFFTKLRIDFVVTPSGICYQRNMELYHKDVYWLYVDFGYRINKMLDCLPDRCVPDSSLQSPQTVPGYEPSYSADVQIIANYAHSAQKIIRDIGIIRGEPPTSLIDFRSKDFIVDTLAPSSSMWIRDYYLRRQQPIFVRIQKLIEDFDRQCYDIVHRITRGISTKTSPYIHHATSSTRPLVHMGAPLNVPHQINFRPDGMDAEEIYARSKFARSVEDDSSVAESPVPLDTSNLRTTKAPSDTSLDTENPVPSRSSNLKNMKAPSDTSSISSESDSETKEQPLRRPTRIRRKVTYGFSQDGAYVMEPKVYPARSKERHRTSRVVFGR